MSQVTFGDPRLLPRFWSKIRVNPETGCWEWTGATLRQRGGYAAFSFERRMVYGHRHAYEQMVGPIPSGLHLDHLCRVTCCVRPDHLEPVTPAVNVQRGMAPSAVNVRTDTCHRGHGMADALILARGNRQCRTCKKQRQSDFQKTDAGRAKAKRNSAKYRARQKEIR